MDRKKKIRSVDLMIAAQISLLIGILFLGSFIYFRLIPLFAISVSCLTLFAPLLAILSRLTTLGLRNSKERRSSIVFVCVLSVPLLIWIVSALRFSIPYLYTPAAITGENYKFYSRCVAFVKSQDDHEHITVSRAGHYLKDGAHYPSLHSNGLDTEDVFSEDEISEMLLLSEQMKKFGCLRFQKNMDFILFYKRRNRILPTRPGVAFSINGRNPNDIDDEVINEHKPFFQIANEWYSSRHIVYAGIRGDVKSSLPKSLIDHSLKTEGLENGDNRQNGVTR
ncbi:MAG: hypothetical protein ACYSWO_13570 [Planctomycetota bacterium]